MNFRCNVASITGASTRHPKIQPSWISTTTTRKEEGGITDFPQTIWCSAKSRRRSDC